MSMISTTGVANTEMMPHQPSVSVTRKYWVKYLLTQLRQKRPPMRRWKNITMAPICWTKKTLRVGASTPQDWQIIATLPAPRFREPAYTRDACTDERGRGGGGSAPGAHAHGRRRGLRRKRVGCRLIGRPEDRQHGAGDLVPRPQREPERQRHGLPAHRELAHLDRHPPGAAAARREERH